jgi:hypothetical protein
MVGSVDSSRRLRPVSPTERADALPEQHRLVLAHVADGRAVRRPRARVDDEVYLLAPCVADGCHIAEERDLIRVRLRGRGRGRLWGRVRARARARARVRARGRARVRARGRARARVRVRVRVRVRARARARARARVRV